MGITFIQKFKNAAGEDTTKSALINLVDLAGRCVCGWGDSGGGREKVERRCVNVCEQVCVQGRDVCVKRCMCKCVCLCVCVGGGGGGGGL